MDDGRALYDSDILAWSEQQADLLRRAAAGERVNGLDWENVIEEVEAVGRSELREVRSQLFQATLHLMKLARDPDSPAAAHWRVETRAFLASARDAFAPSMRARVEFEQQYARARDALFEGTRLARTALVPSRTPPFGLDDLLADVPDLDALAARLRD